MKPKTLSLVVLCAILGGLLALVGQVMAEQEDLSIWAAPALWAGQRLRDLSLSGFWGNLGAWSLTVLVSLMPLVALGLWRHKRGAWKREDVLAGFAVPVLFALLYYAINPTLLPEFVGQVYPVAAGGCLLSMGVAWLVLRLLRGLEDYSQEQLPALLRPLLVGGGGLLAFSTVYAQVATWMSRGQAVIQGNTGEPDGAVFTSMIFGVLALLEMAPYFMGAVTLLWGADLADALGTGFGAETVERCERTASGCKWMVQASVIIALQANLLQLALFGQMRSTYFSVYIPVFPLLLSAGLFLLCRLVRRGRALQEDSDSII